ncbi:MAG: phage integrase family protein [Desulfobacteraceae bacterium]|nr:phage integrase family protein [Desulfobacteraceae bacterium]
MINNSIKTNAGDNYLTVKEEKQFFKTIKQRKGKQAERDYMLLHLARATGLRRAELVALNVGDVLAKEVLIVDERIAKKGGVGKVKIPVADQVLLQRFVRLKAKWGESLDPDAPLFVSRKKNRIAKRTINDLMEKWCKEAGITRYTPHALRHTKARRIIEAATGRPEIDNGVKKLLFVQAQLRHKSINSTAIYTTPTKEEMSIVSEL